MKIELCVGAFRGGDVAQREVSVGNTALQEPQKSLFLSVQRNLDNEEEGLGNQSHSHFHRIPE